MKEKSFASVSFFHEKLLSLHKDKIEYYEKDSDYFAGDSFDTASIQSDECAECADYRERFPEPSDSWLLPRPQCMQGR